MPERRRARTAGGQVKAQRPTTQTTLKNLFQKTNSGTPSLGKEHDSHLEHTDSVAPSRAADPDPPAQPSRSPNPRQLFPIFTRVSSAREKPRDAVIIVDDAKPIDITDASSDIELSTEPPLSSTYHLTPHLESSQEASHLPPPSTIRLNVPNYSDTSFPHADTHGHARPYKTSKVSNKWTLGLGDVAPLPSSCSQHVRGVQHSYASSHATLNRRVLPSLRSSTDGGTLDFLTKWRPLDDTRSTGLDRIQSSLAPQQCEEHLQSLSHNHVQSHPAFARIFACQEKIPPGDGGEMWTRRFRPRRANEVLGNERHALYLRDWLHALELHMQDRQPEEPELKGARGRKNKEKSKSEGRGVKRRRVVRAVTRKRNRKKRRIDSDDDLDDFVVFSDADEEQPDDPGEDSEDELAFCQRTLAFLQRGDTTDMHDVSNDADTEIKHTASQSQEPVQTNFGDELTNTLLITGPPGCGKTAAVYACAEELGWDVFEVYPGIGKRNGASLEHFVGDVGRNHIVRTVNRGARTKAVVEAKAGKGLREYLAKRKMGEFAGFGESQEAGTEGQPISVDGDSPKHGPRPLPPEQETGSSDEAGISGLSHAESDESGPKVRQSLVLLEEVDILFKEDAGFWPGVVEFIRGCQRPVVMTCNDAGLVPVGDLPLQNTLVFEPCPSAVATTFLQCVSLAEGCLVPREDLMVLYENMGTIDGLDMPEDEEYARADGERFPDLRRSITELQTLCAGARHGSAREKHQDDEASGHVRRSGQAISVESRVERTVDGERWRKMKQDSEVMSHVDAELCRMRRGREEVAKEDEEIGYTVLDGREGFVFWERDELIAEEAIRHSRGVHAAYGTGPMEASINPARRRGSGARVAYQTRMLEALQGIVGGVGVMGELGVFLDYIPWVRHMVFVEDDMERRERVRGRNTRNSSGAMRVVGGVIEREEMRRSRLY